MASRIWRFILILPVLCAALPSQAEESASPAISAGEGTVLDPRIERRRVKEAQINADNLEFGLWTGMLSIEDFGTSTLAGASAAFHISEDIAFEALVQKARGGETSFEKLGAVRLLNDKDREWLGWSLNVSYKLLPGEAFLGSHRAFNTGLYFSGGAGSTRFAGDDHFTLNAAAGYQVLLTDWVSLRMEMRDYFYQSDIFGTDEVTQNLAWTLGITGFF